MKNKELGSKSPGTMMLYATKDSLVKRLIDDKENNCDKNFEIRNPKINRFGFIGALLNGFISDGTNKVFLFSKFFYSIFNLFKILFCEKIIY